MNQPAKPKGARRISTVKPKSARANPLVLSEVQEAMNFTTENSSEWLNNDLLSVISEHPLLAHGMTNPRLMQAVEELKRDPKLATSKYRDDQEVQAFFAEFSKTMASHFERLGRTKEDEIAQKIRDSPELQEILQDKEVQGLLQNLREGKGVDFHEIVYRDQSLAFKMKTLIDRGIVNLQT